jgi:hypothetical protein
MALYAVRLIVNGKESEVLLQLLAQLNDMDGDRLMSYVEVSVAELADEEEEEFPHGRYRQSD